MGLLSAPASPAAPLLAGLLSAWLAQSHDLLALTDATGCIRWCSPAFERSGGLGAGADLSMLALPTGPSHDTLTAGLRGLDSPFAEVALRGAAGATLWRRSARCRRRRRPALDAARHHRAARACRACAALRRAARHHAGVRPPRCLGARNSVWRGPLGPPRVRLLGHSARRRHARPIPGGHARAPDDRSNVYLDSTRSAGRYAARYRVVRPDGSLRQIHSQWDVKNSALGVPARTVGIMVDDTEVYELAQAHDHTAAQLKLATELADILIWRHDLKTDRVHYNDHGFKVLGIPHRPDDLSLAEARAQAHPDDAQKLADSSAHALATGVPIDVEVRHRRSDGVWRHMLVRRVIERDAAGEVIVFVGVTARRDRARGAVTPCRAARASPGGYCQRGAHWHLVERDRQPPDRLECADVRALRPGRRWRATAAGPMDLAMRAP